MGKRLVALDGLRGIAALCVFLLHAEWLPFLPRFASGYLAVDLFFLISGFILAKIYMPRFSSGLSLSEFTYARLFRFYPLYLFGFAMGLCFAVVREFVGRSAGEYGFPWSVFFGIAMLPSFNLINTPPYVLYPFNGPSWSLFFELILNISLLPILIRVNPVTFRIMIGILFLLFGFFTINNGTVNIGFGFNEAMLGLLRSAFSFSYGIALFRWTPRPDWVPKTRLAPFAAMLLLAPNFGPGLVQASYDLIFVAVVGPVIALSCINARVTEGYLHTTYDLLGRLSYPIYMVHVPVMFLFSALSARIPLHGMYSAMMFSMSLVIAVLLLSAAAMLVDERLQRWFRRRFRRDPVTVPIRSPSSAG